MKQLLHNTNVAPFVQKLQEQRLNKNGDPDTLVDESILPDTPKTEFME
jgi:hypothetical protein